MATVAKKTKLIAVRDRGYFGVMDGAWPFASMQARRAKPFLPRPIEKAF
jgi:hypothetical protein